MDIQIDRQQLVEIIKCQGDPCYFVNTYILNGNGDDDQLSMIREIHKHASTTSMANFCQEAISAYFLWYALFHKNKSMCYLSKNLTQSKEFMKYVRKMYGNLPEYIACPLKYNNMGYIEFDNGCVIRISAATDNSLRGYVINLLCFDDFSIYKESVKQYYTHLYQHLSQYTNKIIYNN